MNLRGRARPGRGLRPLARSEGKDAGRQLRPSAARRRRISGSASYFCAGGRHPPPAGGLHHRRRRGGGGSPVAWAGVALLGGGAASVARGPGRATRVVLSRPARVEPSWEWIYPLGAESAEVEAAAGGRCRSAARRDGAGADRRAAIPAVPRDAGPADLPNEGGLEDTAISYTKGCYLGQEIMARLQIARQRAPPAVEGGSAARFGAAGASSGRAAGRSGELRSAATRKSGGGFIGLAMLTPSAACGGRSAAARRLAGARTARQADPARFAPEQPIPVDRVFRLPAFAFGRFLLMNKAELVASRP